ncbi:MAG: hypothetical protein IMF07_04300 [Proteobacteria bacterium]|nr:hypothetical protein [Pseudomonadota bacterium]
MKKIKYLVGVVAVSMLFVGCSTTSEKFRSQSVTPDIRNSMVADFEVIGKVKGSASHTFIGPFPLFKFVKKEADGVGFAAVAATPGTGSPLEALMQLSGAGGSMLKSEAAYNALKGSGADYILNPTYEVKKTGFIINQVSVTVQGWGAKVKGYRQMPDKRIFPTKE